MDNKKAVIEKTTDNDDLVPEGRGFLHCWRLHKALIQMERFVIHDPLSWRTTVYFKYRNGVRLYMAIVGFWPKRCMCCTKLLHGKGIAAHIHLRNDKTEQYLGAMCDSCNTQKHNLRNPHVNLQNGVKVVKIKNEWCRLKPDRPRGILPGEYLHHDWYKCYRCDFEGCAKHMTNHNNHEYSGNYPPMGCPAPGCGKSFCTEESLKAHSKRTHGKTYVAIIRDLRENHHLNCGWTREGGYCYGTCPLCNDKFSSAKVKRHFTNNHPEIGKEELKSVMPTMMELTDIIRAEFDIVPISNHKNFERDRAKRAKLSEPSDDGDE